MDVFTVFVIASITAILWGIPTGSVLNISE
jgi:hypothetical protein